MSDFIFIQVLFVVYWFEMLFMFWLICHIDKKYDKKIKEIELSNLDLLHQVKIKEKENE